MLRLPGLRALPIDAAFTLLCAALAGVIAPPAHADLPESILHTFSGANGDGAEPYASLIEASDGTFFGDTYSGGANDEGCVYSLSTNGVVKTVYSFGATSDDGAHPVAAPIFGPDGNLYGLTRYGGAYGSQAGGYGTVYKLTRSGKETILHSFAGGSDGANPLDGLTFGTDGQLYGVSLGNGGTGQYGTIFSLRTNGNDYLTQYRFDFTDGYEPDCTLTRGAGNVFYGTTVQGTSYAYSNGTVFEFTPGSTDGGGTLKTLHAFGNSGTPNDGQNPAHSELMIGSNGELYGVATGGGQFAYGCVYELSTSGVYTTLHSFNYDLNGRGPQGSLLLGSDNNYYGITPSAENGDPGTVYRISPDGSDFAIVYTFGANDTDGINPECGLIEDSNGNLLGTTATGGEYDGDSAQGIVYKFAAGLPNPVKVYSVGAAPATVVGGSSGETGAVVLAMPAPMAGAVVSLASSNPSVASVPASVTLAANVESTTFPINTSAVNGNATATITATYNGSTESGTLAVVPPGLKSIVLTPASVEGGTAATTANRVYWTGNAPANELVTLASSNTAVASVPATVTIGAGSSSHIFTLTTKSVTTTQTLTITATCNGVKQTATLTVTPPPAVGLKSVILSPTSTGGGTSSTANRVYWSGNAPANEIVTLTSSNTAIATVPSSVTISSGSSSHPFTITTKAVTNSQSVTVTATSGGVSQSATLTVTS